MTRGNGCRRFPLGLADHQKERRMTVTASLAEIAHRDLAHLNDNIVGPADPGYDEARAVHNGMIDRRPALIVRCSSADDVAQVIAFARTHEAPLAVRGGGHNGGGLGVVDDGVVIDLAGLDEVVVDPESETVRVGGGCTWGRGRRGDGRVRPRDAIGDHLDNGRRRADARRWTGTPHAALRVDDRQPDRRRCRARRRLAGPRQRRSSTPSCSGRYEVAAATSAS